MTRLEPQPGEVIDRSALFTFRWNGRTCPAFRGDTIASALAASGVRVFSRSFKYHRPRGLLTASHLDPGCIVQVGDEPNVRAAHRLAEPGLDVRSQNTWPTLRHDLKAINSVLAPFLPPGFYYKTFITPHPLWPLYERVLRRFTHAGALPNHSPQAARRVVDHRSEVAPVYDKRYAFADVVVAGGGPAGMAAAIAAARAGARVMLVEEEHQLGGHLRWGDESDLAALAGLREQVVALGIEVLTDSVVLGRYDDNLVAVLERGRPGGGERLIKARPSALVVAPGLIERPYVFAGNDVPGVMLSTAVRRLINLYAVKPGARAVVVTGNADGDACVADLKRAGVDVAHVEDLRLGGNVVRVHGRSRVRAIELVDGGRIECDLVVVAAGWTAPTALLNMAGNVPVYQPASGLFRPDLDALPADVLATGGLVGEGSLDELVAHGSETGRIAARRSAGQLGTDEPRHAGPLGTDERGGHAGFRGRTDGVVDFSEDVGSGDLRVAVGEGYDSMELAKRYTTATMGPMQGKLELANTVAVVAESTGRTIAETGTTTWRPPYAPVTLGALAGPQREPVRYSPMHPWHLAHDARPLVAGGWIRPDHYGDPAAEARAVRDSVGIIDVTPIGKLDLRGPDLPDLLNLLYVNKWSKLATGRVRYGVMCAEDGVVLDDGVTGRLGPEHYLMSTTSSGAATVWEWLELWLQTERPGWQVHVTPVTTAYASINVAGPRSRELLARLVSEVDLAAEAFGYMQVRTGRIAGVGDCVLWRIGFTGELSYELHVPASYGLHVWEALLAAGDDLGVRAFGVEAQRILRLEKGHLIVGQDTDGLTRGYGASLGGLVKLDKDDFAGKPELAWQAAGGDHDRLVGLHTVDGSIVPAEGCQLVEGDRLVGRVTSSRMSPTLGRSVCLGQVASRLADPGTEVWIRLTDGRTVAAQVTEHLAAVDPEGVRLRG